MADSNITKKALARALRELMEEMPFEKISVAQICEKCDMNRKSFYYHFKDKYDLVNWIFDTDFISITTKLESEGYAHDELTYLIPICHYFYRNRDFYRKALKVEGQNSFSEHLKEFMYPLLKNRLKNVLGKKEVHPLYINFLTDGLYCAIERWISDKDCMPPDEFVNIIITLVDDVAVYVYNKNNK